jgi:hypothetical protein
LDRSVNLSLKRFTRRILRLEEELPHNDKHTRNLGDETHIMTSKLLLVEVSPILSIFMCRLDIFIQWVDAYENSNNYNNHQTF